MGRRARPGPAATGLALAETPDGYTLGTGTWSTEGPGKNADVVGLERQEDGSLRMTGWDDCQLRVAIPEGRSPVVVKAPRGGVDAASTEPTVMVNELQCTSARDPVPFLGEPNVVEDDERVLVTMTSEVKRGGADCQGNPSVPITLELDEPIGTRELLDGGTWPPTPVKVTKADSWQSVEHEGALVDVPGDWERLDVSGCNFDGADVPRFAPPGTDPCDVRASGVAFYGSATFDPISDPGLHRDAVDEAWSGYVYAGEWAVNVWSADADQARRILGSARESGHEAPDLSAGWRTETYGGTSVEVPSSWRAGGLSAWCLNRSVPGWVERPHTAIRSIRCSPRSGHGIRFVEGPKAPPAEEGLVLPGGQDHPGGARVAHRVPEGADGYVTVVAPTQALAQLILGSVRKE